MKCTPIVARLEKAMQSGRFNVYVFEGGSRCFAGDVKVITSDGFKLIRDIVAGDMVKCLDERGEQTFAPVTGLHRFAADKQMIRIVFKNGNVITCSVDHKFRYYGMFVPIMDIINSVGIQGRAYRRPNEIRRDDILRWDYVDDVEEVYDIEVADHHNYFIEAAHECCVHNSSKTYSLIQSFIIYALRNKNRQTRVAIARKKTTWILATVWPDFKKILLETGIKHKVNNSKSVITIYSTTFEFIGLDDVQRLHGLTTDIFWINEAMEASKDDFDQLEQRTSRFAILDYNPSAEQHWIYDTVCTRPDCYFDHSTMLDNPFIPENSRRKILSYEPTEENYANGTADERKWKIYGLGLRAKIEGLIFDHYDIVKDIPEGVDRRWYCVDFGFANDPTAIAEVGFYHNTLYIKEHCYEAGLLTRDIITRFQKLMQRRPLRIISESADPRLVKEMQQAGLPVIPVTKYAGSIEAGIDFMRGCKIVITEDSVNVKTELDNYTYAQDKSGKWLNYPVDDFNHCFSADTLIATDNGLVPISGIEAGVRVLTSSGYRKVLKRFDNGVRTVRDYAIETARYTIRVTATPDHKIKTSKGWTQISELKKGDSVFIDVSGLPNAKDSLSAKPVFVVLNAVRRITASDERSVEVYDLNVDEVHEYFANGLLVHNCLDGVRYVCLENLIGRNGQPVDLNRVAAAIHR